MKRAGDFIPQIYWVYNQTGEKWLLDLAWRIYHKTLPERNQWMDDHGVHFMQRFRYAAQMFPMAKDSFYLNKTNYYYEQFLNTWGQMPRGGIAADERIRNGKVDPRQGIETCAMVEANKSFYILGNITGNVKYADKVEDMTFNWLPASHTPDLKGLRYITAANMPISVPHMDFHNQGMDPVFAASMHRCCQHNSAMGWPWFIKNMWKASPGNGLVAWLYGPCQITAKAGSKGKDVHIISETNYPFSDVISLKFTMDDANDFPLYLRIPGWANNVELKINGKNQEEFKNKSGSFIRIERLWNSGDEVQLKFNPQVKLRNWPRTHSVTVERGPLSYSVRIKENWVKMKTDHFGWDIWEVLPASDWNYGFDVDQFKNGENISVDMQQKITGQPWEEENAPIVLTVPVKKITDWKTGVLNTVDPLREGPVRSDEPVQEIEMIPMGAAHLRMTCLPVISDGNNARYWKDIPDPNKFMVQ